jgi:hypothetical protein
MLQNAINKLDTRHPLKNAYLTNPADIPISLDFSHRLPPMRYQGRYCTSVEHAICTILEYQHGLINHMSPAFIFFLRSLPYFYNSHDSLLTIIEKSLAVVQKIGVCLEKSYPYYKITSGKIKERVIEKANKYRIEGYGILNIKKVKELKIALFHYGPLLMAWNEQKAVAIIGYNSEGFLVRDSSIRHGYFVYDYNDYIPRPVYVLY